MVVETKKDIIGLNQLAIMKNNILEIEGDVIVNDVKPDVLKIVNTKGMVFLYKEEVLENRVRIDGSANIYIMYIADDENSSLRSINTVLDFNKFLDIDGATSDMDLDGNINIKNIECTMINSRKMHVKVTMDMKVNLYSHRDIEYINDIPNIRDIQVLKKQKNINSLVGRGTTKTYAKDTINIPNDLMEIANIQMNITNKSSKPSYNKMLAKADLMIEIMYLNESNNINNINTKIPVMGFIDVANIDEEDLCDVKYKIKNCIVKPNNTEEHSIYIEVEIEIVCFVYKEKRVELIEDMYSTNSRVSFKSKEVMAPVQKITFTHEQNINQLVDIMELEGKEIQDINMSPRILEVKPRQGEIMVNGELDTDILYRNNGVTDLIKTTIPFNTNINSNMIETGSNVEVNVESRGVNFNETDDGKINTSIDLIFYITAFKNEKLNIINEISNEDIDEEDLYSMVIYFVKPGDTLWEIAKKFRTTVQDIARTNGIQDEDRIYPGQQLYIPKVNNRNIAV